MKIWELITGAKPPKPGEMGKIVSIEEIENFETETEFGYGLFAGYRITTENFIINCLIDNRQSCCEEWGYLSSADNLSDFIGAEALTIEIIEIDNSIKNDDSYDKEEKINLETSKGLLQFSVYQKHNGYYTHGTIVQAIEVRKRRV